jgi:hypothetical protein
MEVPGVTTPRLGNGDPSGKTARGEIPLPAKFVKTNYLSWMVKLDKKRINRNLR